MKYLTVGLLFILITATAAQASTIEERTPRSHSFATSRYRLAHHIEWHIDKRHELARKRRQARRAQAAAAAAVAATAAAVAATPVPTSTPTATISTTTSYSGGVLSDGEFQSLLLAAGFPSSVLSEMTYIGHRESGLCPTAVNGYGCAGAGHAYAGGPACGLLQLFPCPGPQALIPATNIAIAYGKYHARGLSPWAATS